MAGNVVRIGDRISCGDQAAQGSGDVFVNDKPVTHKGTNKTTGHGKDLPTVFKGPYSQTVFVNDQPVVLKGITQIVPHTKKNKHTGATPSTSSNDVSIEE